MNAISATSTREIHCQEVSSKTVFTANAARLVLAVVAFNLTALPPPSQHRSWQRDHRDRASHSDPAPLPDRDQSPKQAATGFGEWPLSDPFAGRGWDQDDGARALQTSTWMPLAEPPSRGLVIRVVSRCSFSRLGSRSGPFTPSDVSSGARREAFGVRFGVRRLPE